MTEETEVHLAANILIRIHLIIGRDLMRELLGIKLDFENDVINSRGNVQISMTDTDKERPEHFVTNQIATGVYNTSQFSQQEL